jgi:hypothetical protein
MSQLMPLSPSDRTQWAFRCETPSPAEPELLMRLVNHYTDRMSCGGVLNLS